MEKIRRLMVNICSDNLSASSHFYTKLFDFTIVYDSDWFVQLISKDAKCEIGIIDKTHEIVPENYQQSPQGFYVTFVVDDVDKVFKIAQAEGITIIRQPEDTFYGQRRLLLKDPDGTLVDVSAPIKGFAF